MTRLVLQRLWPVAALLGVLLALLLFRLDRLSPTYDETPHLFYGLRMTAGNSDRFDDSKMPVSAINALPVALTGFDAAQLRASRNPAPQLHLARRVTIGFALVLALIVFCWASELYGYAAGLLALGLYVLEPNLAAHSQLVTTDLYATLFITLSLYAYWRLLAKPGKGRLLVSAFALGFAQVAKYSATYLFPIFLLIALVWLWRQPRARALWLRFGGAVAIHLLACLIVINAAFLFNRTGIKWGEYDFKSSFFLNLRQATPVLANVPVPLPYPYLQGLDLVKYGDESGTGFGRIYLLGELRSNRGFPSYYLVAFLFKTPLGLQVFLLWAVVQAWRRRSGAEFFRNEFVLAVPALFFAIYFSLFFQAQIGIRYLLVIYPLLIVFAGSLARDWRQLGPKARLAGAGLLLWIAGSNLSYAGHYLSYFNELVGNRRNSYKILADSNLDWGQNINYRADYLAEHPETIPYPPSPQPGHFLVDANLVVGVADDRPGGWLRDFEPTGHLVYSYLLFDITPEDLARLRVGKR